MTQFRLAQAIADLEPSATEEVDNRVKQMRHTGIDDIISLGAGEPCFDTPDSIRQAACDALWAGETTYQPTGGSFDLREAIRDKFKRENGIDVGVEQILATAGGKFAVYLAFQTLLQKGDTVLLLDPAWVSYEAMGAMTGARVTCVPTDARRGFQPDLDAVRAALDPSVRLMVVNSPCNPTGAVYPADTLRALAEMTAANNTVLLSDEVYEYQIYDAAHYSPASQFDHVVTVNAFSKSHAMTGWRLGYLAAPAPIVEGMAKIYQHSTSCVTAFAQRGGVEALTGAAARRAAADMTAAYRAKRSLMLELIERSAFFHQAAAPQGAFYCFPAYRAQMPSLELATALLEQAHVATVPGGAFGPSGEGHLRLSYATTDDNIRAAFERMEHFFGSLTS